MSSIVTWSFTAGPASGNCLAPVALGSAAPFGAFGGTAGMTNSGTLTVINGDIGTIATGTSSITGFHDTAGDIYTETPANIGTVNGMIFTCTNSTTGPNSAGPNAANCNIAKQARLDAQTAYLALAGMPAGANPGANLGGLTLAPGDYTAAAGRFMIQGADLTLDAGGNANAVWVFQMATTLTVGGPGATAPQSVILVNGAQAKNVFWQVGSAATINAAGGGTMVGTIISQAGAAFSTVGNTTVVTLDGRVLSLGASVTWWTRSSMCLPRKVWILVEQHHENYAPSWDDRDLVAIAVVIQAPCAFADDAGWYTGFNVGQSRAKIDDARIVGGLLGDGFTTTSISNDDRHFGFKRFGGYEFNRYFALESGYFDLGRFGFWADTLPSGSLRGDIKVRGANFDLVGSVPIGDKFPCLRAPV